MTDLKSIEYSPEDYEVIETQTMTDELGFKLVKFNTGYYGVINYNQKTNMEKIILISPDTADETTNPFHIKGLGCKSFMVFARDAKNYLENAPVDLVVLLGTDAPVEYREAITRDEAKTLREKVEICLEILELKQEDSFIYKYGDLITLICFIMVIFCWVVALINILTLFGVI